MGLPREQVALLKARFLDGLRQRGNIATAAREVRITRRTLYKWREADNAFAEAFADAAEEALESMEWKAHRRCVPPCVVRSQKAQPACM
jgi:hypothetical protein